MAGEVTPNVTVVQEIQAEPTVTATPTLVPCVAAVCNQIVEVLDAGGGLNAAARYSLAQYNQGDVFIPQADFPDPRDNLDEIAIDASSVRAFMNFGGSLREYPRGSHGTKGEAFLATMAYHHRRPMLLTTASLGGSFAFDGTVGDVLILAFDVPNPTDTSRDVIITFVGTLTKAQVVAKINAAVGATVARLYTEPASNPYAPNIAVGETAVQIFSTRASARGSITLRAGASALPILFGAGFDSTKEYRIEGSGLRGQDDGDGDLFTPWIELHGGGYFVDGVDTAFPTHCAANSVWAAISSGYFPGDVENYDDFSNSKAITSVDFTDTATFMYPMKAGTSTSPGDQLWVDGSLYGGGAEIVRVEPTRFRLGVLDTVRSTFDDAGVATSRVYTPIEVNLITHPSPFAPTYAWLKARGLTFPGDGTGVAATLTGTVAAAEARPAIVQGTGEITFPLAAAGLTLLVTVTEDGVDHDQATLVFAGGPFANMGALITALEAAVVDAGLDGVLAVDAPSGADRLALMTVKAGADQGVSVAAAGTANTALQFSTTTATASVGVDEEISVAPSVTGEHISLPLVGMGAATLEIVVTDNYGTHTVEVTGVDLASHMTLGDLRDDIATAFGNNTPTDGILYDGVIPIAVLTTSGDGDVHGTLTITAYDGGADVELELVATSISDGFRALGFHDDDGDNWAEVTSGALALPEAGLNGATLTVTYNPGGISLSAALGAPEAAATTPAALAALLNATAALTTSGSRRVWYVGNNTTGRLLVRTVSGGVTTNVDVDISGGSVGLLLGFTGVLDTGTADGSNANDAGANGLRTKSLQVALDFNPSVYEISLPSNSLPECVDEINNVIGAASAIATMSNGRELVITSALLGAGSLVRIVGGTAQTLLGFDSPNNTDFGAGRPLPDFYLDSEGNAHLGAQILRDRQLGIPFRLNSAIADVYLQYTALRRDVTAMASSPGLLAFDSTAAIDAAIGPISAGNPLALGMFLAKANAPLRSVSGIGIDEANDAAPEGTLDGWVRCLEYIESKEVYAFVPLQRSPAISALVKEHVIAMNVPDARAERIALLWGEAPTRHPSTSVASGSDAQTNGISNSITVESNPSDELVAAGIDVGAEIPVSAGVYFEALISSGGATTLVRYSVKNVSGVVLTLRTSFTGTQNADGFYTTTVLDGLAGYTGIDWTIKVRGAELFIPGTTTLDLAAVAAAIAAEAPPYKHRKVYLGYAPSVDITIDGITQNVPGYYLMACIAGMISARSPRDPLHLVAIGGVDRVYGTDDTLGKHLDTAADGGRMIFINDGSSVVCRHCRSTDNTSVETRELSITTQIDWVAKGFRQINRELLRGKVITPGFLTELGIANQGFCALVTGTVVNDCTVDSILQDESNKDRILVTVELDPSYPANRIRVTIVV